MSPTTRQARPCSSLIIRSSRVEDWPLSFGNAKLLHRKQRNLRHYSSSSVGMSTVASLPSVLSSPTLPHLDSLGICDPTPQSCLLYSKLLDGCPRLRRLEVRTLYSHTRPALDFLRDKDLKALEIVKLEGLDLAGGGVSHFIEAINPERIKELHILWCSSIGPFLSQLTGHKPSSLRMSVLSLQVLSLQAQRLKMKLVENFVRCCDSLQRFSMSAFTFDYTFDAGAFSEGARSTLTSVSIVAQHVVADADLFARPSPEFGLTNGRPTSPRAVSGSTLNSWLRILRFPHLKSVMISPPPIRGQCQEASLNVLVSHLQHVQNVFLLHSFERALDDRVHATVPLRRMTSSFTITRVPSLSTSMLQYVAQKGDVEQLVELFRTSELGQSPWMGWPFGLPPVPPTRLHLSDDSLAEWCGRFRPLPT